MLLKKLDWWKINSIWTLVLLVLFWVNNFLYVALAIVLAVTLLELLIAYAFWKQSKLIFWLSLIANLFAIYKIIIREMSGTLLSSDILSVISIILFLGLAKQFFHKN